MILSEKNLDIWYKDYVKKYKNAEKFVASKGGNPPKAKMLSRQRFTAYFNASVNDNPTLSGKQIAEKMAKDSVYSLTLSQAKRAAEASFRKYGIKISLSEITRHRMGLNSNLWQDITDRRAELFMTTNKTAEEVALAISQEFFGS